jgi:peptide/nickel transport system ATP-binding protein
MSLIRIQDLNVHFKTETGAFHAVKNFSLQLDRGESVAIVGESGSGKSVSVKAIMGLLDERSVAGKSGKILFCADEGEQDLMDLKGSEWQNIRGKKIAMIFQEPMSALNPVMTCGRQILEAVRLHRKLKGNTAKAEAIRLLEEVQVKEALRIFSSYPHQISGGQRQRVMIAMALAGNPELLIADEPTTALDVSVQAAILRLLRKIQRERNMALIFISHDLEVVRRIAGRIVVMFHGQILEEAESELIFRNPQHVYTQALIKCKPSLQYREDRLPVMQDFFSLDDAGRFVRKDFLPEQPVPAYEQRSEEILLEVKRLKVTYAGGTGWGIGTTQHPVLRGLDFTIYRGETLGLLGESGSGKSTLGRAMMQLLKYSGDIFWKGEKLEPGVRRKRKVLAKKIQMIYQDPYSSLNPRLRVGAALEEVMRIHHIGFGDRERKERSGQLLEKVGLNASAADKFPHEFSGGQRQRVSIARALAVEPEFIVCDEAVSALDVSVQAQVLNLLCDIREEFGLTYLFITHDLSVVRHIADRILILNKGEIAELGKTEDIFHDPEKAYTKELLNAYLEME